MSRKPRKYIPRPFESNGRGGAYAAIYLNMLESPAWRDLTASQKVLYLACKSHYFGDKENPDGDERNFSMNRAKWLKYGLYKPGNAEGFYRDMEQLILHGFVRCIHQGKANHQKNIYQFSDKWARYGNDDFLIEANEMTAGMLKRHFSETTKEQKK